MSRHIYLPHDAVSPAKMATKSILNIVLYLELIFIDFFPHKSKWQYVSFGSG